MCIRIRGKRPHSEKYEGLQHGKQQCNTISRSFTLVDLKISIMHNKIVHYYNKKMFPLRNSPNKNPNVLGYTLYRCGETF